MNPLKYSRIPIAIVFTMAMFFLSCEDTYKRVGDEATEIIYPVGVAQNFVLTYTEAERDIKNQDKASSRIIAVLESPLSENFENLKLGYRTFPNGLLVTFYNEDKQKSIIRADYAILYEETNLVDLRGNVILESHDGKKLETDQLYWDRANEWIFTQEKFTYRNPEDGTIMDGEGMDFNRDFSYFRAHKTYGLMTIKEES